MNQPYDTVAQMYMRLLADQLESIDRITSASWCRQASTEIAELRARVAELESQLAQASENKSSDLSDWDQLVSSGVQLQSTLEASRKSDLAGMRG